MRAPPWGLLGAAKLGDRKPGSASRAKGACPTSAAAQGSQALLRGGHICRGCREPGNLPSAPPEERRGRSLTPRLGASGSGGSGHLGAPRPPPPTSQTGTSLAQGYGLAKVAGKGSSRRPAPPPAQSPSPRASHSPCWRRSAPPARRSSLARIRTLLPGAGSGRVCEAGGQQTTGGKTRPGGRTPEPDW